VDCHHLRRRANRGLGSWKSGQKGVREDVKGRRNESEKADGAMRRSRRTGESLHHGIVGREECRDALAEGLIGQTDRTVSGAAVHLEPWGRGPNLIR